MRAAWAYFANWPETAQDFAELAKTKLPMPVLAIAGEKASASTLFPQMKLVANDVNVVGLNDAGHWLMEERPKETIEALMKVLSCVPTRRLDGQRGGMLNAETNR